MKNKKKAENFATNQKVQVLLYNTLYVEAGFSQIQSQFLAKYSHIDG